jgi:uncharacterized protein involved in exopolysaccharide biosynthesis
MGNDSRNTGDWDDGRERQLPGKRREDDLDLGKYIAILRKSWWKVALLSVGVGAVTLLWMLRMPNVYVASAVITPVGDDTKTNPALGAIASFGVSVGGPTKADDLETIYKSGDLTVRVFRKYEIWPIVLKDRFDPKTGQLKPGGLAALLGLGGEPKPPGDWDAIRVAGNSLAIQVNRKAGTLTISFESPSAEGSSKIVGYYLEEAKNRLQEEAFERAARNKKFIEEQIGRTVDALTRDRLYSLYGQEVEREMLARNREQFGFRVIDSARVPDRKAKPQRAKTAVLATILAFPVWAIFVGYLGQRRENLPPASVREGSAG